MSALRLYAIAIMLFAHAALAVDSQILISPVGEFESQQFGLYVSPAGDINADGFDDILIGTIANSPTDAYVFFGGPDQDDEPDLTFNGDTNEQFGRALAALGDVNADGYDDMAITAHNAGAMAHGEVYIYFGGPDVDNIPDLTLEAPSDSSGSFGWAVATAGDFNADGYRDFVVGDKGYDMVGDPAGAAHVYFGGPGLDAEPDLSLYAPQVSSWFGGSVAGGSDVNGDGYDDLLIGMEYWEEQRGGAQLFYGGPEADTVADVSFYGEEVYDRLGCDVALPGDIDGDGFGDLLLGSPGGSMTSPGFVWIVRGGLEIHSTPDAILEGESMRSKFGCALASTGDINEDGFADFVVGAVLELSPSTGEEGGAAYLFLGSGELSGTYHKKWSAYTTDQYLGVDVACAGDFDGDGYPDVVIGASRDDTVLENAGRAHVYSLFPLNITAPRGGEFWVAGEEARISWKGTPRVDLALSYDGGLTWNALAHNRGGSIANTYSFTVPYSASPGVKVAIYPTGTEVGDAEGFISPGVVRIVTAETPPSIAARLQIAPGGQDSDTGFGETVAAAGDINGDGFDDVLVGAPVYPEPMEDSGQAYIYFGGPAADNACDVVYESPWEEAWFSAALAGGSDLNGDGYDDVLIGAPMLEAGKAALYFGGTTPSTSPDLIFSGSGHWDQFGCAIDSRGDFNGDGHPDIVIGSATGEPVGQASVYYGGPLLDTVADVTFAGEASGDHFGLAVAYCGDLNADGYDDITVGAPDNDAGGQNAGRVYIFCGGPDADASADLILTGEEANENFGLSLCGLGDANRDGWDDLLVGAYRNDAGGIDAGCARLYYGGTVLDASADLVFQGEAGDRFGRALAGGEDLNGDGRPDFVIAAHWSDAGGSNTGRVHVYFGRDLLPAQADVILGGEAPDDQYGAAVALIGDANHNGCSDLAVGAPGNDGIYPGYGRLYLHDLARYHILAPAGGETWDVGALQTVSWRGAQRANLWLSVDGGASFDLLASDVGGRASNHHTFRVPHQPTRFAALKLTPSDPAVLCGAVTADFFTIDASIALLGFRAAPPEGGGGMLLSWNTNPGPETLSGYRIEAKQGDAWKTLADQHRETSYLDPAGDAFSHYRLFAINGLGEDFLLGEITPEALRALHAWPLPYRAGLLNVQFATAGGLGGACEDAHVGIFDINGRLVRTIAAGRFTAGTQTATWDGRDAAGQPVGTGVYFLKADSGAHRNMLRVMVIH